MQYIDKDHKTRAWQYYENGRAYNNQLVPNQYRVVNTNIEFYVGNQWVNVPNTPAMSRIPKPVFNIIKRIASMFIASLTSTAISISFDTLSYYDGAGEFANGEGPRENSKGDEINAATYATAEVQNLLEKFKMQYRIRDALADGAQTGDYCAHFYWDPDAIPYGGAFGPYRGEIQMELVDGINVMFGNPNDPVVENQPYILLIGRDTVANLRAEKRRHDKMKADKARAEIEESGIQADAEYQFQAGVGGKTELIQSDDKNGKCLYVYLYEKVTTEEVIKDASGKEMEEPELDENGDPVPLKDANGAPVFAADGKPLYKMKPAKRMVTSVHVTKSTRGCDIFTDVDTGMTRYPIAWGNWERQKNQYHGRALVTGIIPNQIYINSMFAMVMRHQQLMGFPKTIYNADLIGQWNNEIGQAIAVHGLQPGQRIGDVATNLNPADMSNQIIMAIDKAMQYTRECLGATDVQMGNVRPDNTSALMVLQSNAEVPLENIRAGLYEWIEDIGAILLDMMGTYYGKRPIIRDREFTELTLDATGQPMIDPMTGTLMTNTVTRRVQEEYDFSRFKHLWLNIRADVGATTYYSEIAMVQTLDNLRRDGTLDIINYLERIPDKLIPKKQELIQQLRQTLNQPQMPMEGANPPAPGVMPAPAMGGPLDEEKAIQNMPINIQDDFSTMPKVAQEALLNVQGS